MFPSGQQTQAVDEECLGVREFSEGKADFKYPGWSFKQVLSKDLQ